MVVCRCVYADQARRGLGQVGIRVYVCMYVCICRPGQRGSRTGGYKGVCVSVCVSMCVYADQARRALAQVGIRVYECLYACRCLPRQDVAGPGGHKGVCVSRCLSMLTAYGVSAYGLVRGVVWTYM